MHTPPVGANFTRFPIDAAVGGGEGKRRTLTEQAKSPRQRLNVPHLEQAKSKASGYCLMGFKS